MDRVFRLLPVFFILAMGLLLLYPLAALGARFGVWHFKAAFALLGGGAITGRPAPSAVGSRARPITKPRRQLPNCLSEAQARHLIPCWR